MVTAVIFQLLGNDVAN